MNSKLFAGRVLAATLLLSTTAAASASDDGLAPAGGVQQPVALPLASTKQQSTNPTAAARAVPSPVVTEMRATLQADGSYRVICNKISNPLALGAYPQPKPPLLPAKEAR
jgi:hypothetical protein